MDDPKKIEMTHEQFRVFAKRVAVMARDAALNVMMECRGKTIFAPDLKTVAVEMDQSEVVMDIIIRHYAQVFDQAIEDPIMALWQYELTQNMATIQIALDNGWRRGAEVNTKPNAKSVEAA